MTVIHDEATEAGAARANLITGLLDLAAWLSAHPGSPLPEVRAAFRIPGGPREERVAALNEAAAWLGVPVTRHPGGHLTARRMFGPVPASAGLAAENIRVPGHLLPRATGTAA